MVYDTYDIFRFGRGEYPVNPEKLELVAAGNSRLSLSLSLPDLFEQFTNYYLSLCHMLIFDK